MARRGWSDAARAASIIARRKKAALKPDWAGYAKALKKAGQQTLSESERAAREKWADDVFNAARAKALKKKKPKVRTVKTKAGSGKTHSLGTAKQAVPKSLPQTPKRKTSAAVLAKKRAAAFGSISAVKPNTHKKSVRTSKGKGKFTSDSSSKSRSLKKIVVVKNGTATKGLKRRKKRRTSAQMAKAKAVAAKKRALKARKRLRVQTKKSKVLAARIRKQQTALKRKSAPKRRKRRTTKKKS